MGRIGGTRIGIDRIASLAVSQQAIGLEQSEAMQKRAVMALHIGLLRGLTITRMVDPEPHKVIVSVDRLVFSRGYELAIAPYPWTGRLTFTMANQKSIELEGVPIKGVFAHVWNNLSYDRLTCGIFSAGDNNAHQFQQIVMVRSALREFSRDLLAKPWLVHLARD
jgi:hypothetical protein